MKSFLQGFALCYSLLNNQGVLIEISMTFKASRLLIYHLYTESQIKLILWYLFLDYNI